MKSDRPSQRDDRGDSFTPLRDDARDFLSMLVLVGVLWFGLALFNHIIATFAALLGIGW